MAVTHVTAAPVTKGYNDSQVTSSCDWNNQFAWEITCIRKKMICQNKLYCK